MYDEDYTGWIAGAIVGFLFIGALVAFIWVNIAGFTLHTTNGEHTGFVTAVETGGIFWKTTSAYVKTDTQSSQEDKYCVTDPAVLTVLRAKQESKERITIVFGNGHWVPMWDCGFSDSSIITAIK